MYQAVLRMHFLMIFLRGRPELPRPKFVMKKSTLFLLSGLTALPLHAGFTDDQNASLTARNFYFDRDYKDPQAPYPASREWAQGFIFNYHSGYTNGPIGLGVDLSADIGIQLNSDAQHSASGLLKYDPNTREPEDEYHRVFATAKVKVQDTEIKAGTLRPRNPVIFSSPARLLDQTFRGAELQSKEFEHFKITAAYIDSVKQRDETQWTDLSVSKVQRRYGFQAGDQVQSSHFLYAGLDHSIGSHQSSYYYGNLHDVYQQHVLTYQRNKTEDLPLQAKVQIFRSVDQGAAQVGKIDNWNYGTLLGWSHGMNTFSAGGMLNSGDSALPFLHGGESLVLLDSMSADFSNKNERVWIVRYDRNFADFNLPNLNIMARYNKGTYIDLDSALGGDNLKERSLDTEIRYQVGSGLLKGLNLRARSSIYRNNFTIASNYKDGNETRLNVDYTWNY